MRSSLLGAVRISSRGNAQGTSPTVVIVLALLITLLSALFVTSLDFDLVFTKRPSNFFWRWMELHEFDPAILLAIIIVGLMVFPNPERIGPIAAWFDRSPRITSFAVVVVLAICTAVVYKNHPLSMDEYADWFQSRVFAAGRLAGQWPPELMDWLLPKGFQGGFLYVSKSSGAVMSGYFPGYALVQAPFVFLGVPWLCNPILVGASLLVMAYIARTLFGGGEAAGWVVLFAIASPVFLINGISFYSSSGQLLLNLAFCALLLEPSPKRLFLAGMVGGLSAFYHSPIRHVFFALPWLVWIAWTFRPRIKGLVILTVGYMPGLLILGAAWLHFRGQIMADALSSSELGVALPPLEGMAASLANLADRGWHYFSWPSAYGAYARTTGLIKTWLWSAPLIPLLAVLAVARIKDVRIHLMLLSALATFLAYLFMWADDQGHGWGDRYFHAAWGVLPILAYAWIAGFQKENPERARVLLARIGVGAIASIILAVPLRLWQVNEHMRQHLVQLPKTGETVGRELALIKLSKMSYYAVDLVQNDPWLRGQRLVLLSQGQEQDAKMLAKWFPKCALIEDPGSGASCRID